MVHARQLDLGALSSFSRNCGLMNWDSSSRDERRCTGDGCQVGRTRIDVNRGVLAAPTVGCYASRTHRSMTVNYIARRTHARRPSAVKSFMLRRSCSGTATTDRCAADTRQYPAIMHEDMRRRDAETSPYFTTLRDTMRGDNS